MFKDTAGHWAERHIERIADLGVLRGYEDGTFGPEKPVTRAEVATIVDRLMFGYHELITQIEAALVTVATPFSRGSGTHIGGGYILTNHHVVARRDSETSPWKVEQTVNFFNANVTYNPRTDLPSAAGAEATLVATSAAYDLAVYKRTNFLTVNLPTIPVCTPDHIRTGERVIAVGSPYGLVRTVTEGIVSHPDRRLAYLEGEPTLTARFIQMDAPINPGNSGGALINMAGHLLGVPSAGYQGADGLGFAVRVDSLREWLTAHNVPFEDGHA